MILAIVCLTCDALNAFNIKQACLINVKWPTLSIGLVVPMSMVLLQVGHKVNVYVYQGIVNVILDSPCDEVSKLLIGFLDVELLISEIA